MPSLADYINPRSPAWDAWRSDMDAPRPEMPQPQGEISYRQGPWYERAPQALADYLYGPNATMQQTGSLAKYLGPENPLNIPGQFHQGLNTALGGYAAREPLTIGAGLLTAGMAVAPGPKGPKPAGIRAYHGSPHNFDRFSMDKIGTGEGGQAFGHGLYFAEHEDVAKSYRDTLAAGHPGHMYEVNIKADPADFIDWDKPISQHPDKVRTAIHNVLAPKVERGSHAWRVTVGGDSVGITRTKWGANQLARKMQNAPKWSDQLSADSVPQLLSKFKDRSLMSSQLREAGIPGIRYLDQGSRAGGEGTRNFVVFDDSLIEILRKYGLWPAAGLGAATAYDQQQRPQEAY